MDDVYCPVCRLVLERRGCGGQAAPAHCPRCSAHRRTQVAMLALDQLPAIAGPCQTAPPQAAPLRPIG